LRPLSHNVSMIKVEYTSEGSLPSNSKELRPDLRVAMVAIADLKLDPFNPRLHSKKQIKQLANSIETFGFVSPVLTDGSRRVIAGHGRIEAARLVGFKEVPTISIHHLSEPKIRALI